MTNQEQPRSEGVGAVLAFFPGLVGIWGVGHIYAGKIGLGIALFFLGVLVVGGACGCFALFGLSRTYNYSNEYAWLGAGIILVVVALFIWIFLIFDARSACRDANNTGI